jgi:phosphoglycolate phosphatase
MVGDSPIDIATARAAAIPVIAVEYGYTESPVSELRPDRVIGGLGELPTAVFDLLDVGSSIAAEQR